MWDPWKRIFILAPLIPLTLFSTNKYCILCLDLLFTNTPLTYVDYISFIGVLNIITTTHLGFYN